MRVTIALAAALSIAACGGAAEAPEEGVEAPDAASGTEAEVAADAALAGQAARAEAEDAAIGGNVTAADVSAAGNVALIAQ